jgi:hypothetical protein
VPSEEGHNKEIETEEKKAARFQAKNANGRRQVCNKKKAREEEMGAFCIS